MQFPASMGILCDDDRFRQVVFVDPKTVTPNSIAIDILKKNLSILTPVIIALEKKKGNPQYPADENQEYIDNLKMQVINIIGSIQLLEERN